MHILILYHFQSNKNRSLEFCINDIQELESWINCLKTRASICCEMIWWTTFFFCLFFFSGLDLMAIIIIKACKSFLFHLAFRLQKAFGSSRVLLTSLVSVCSTWQASAFQLAGYVIGAGSLPPAQHPSPIGWANTICEISFSAWTLMWALSILCFCSIQVLICVTLFPHLLNTTVYLTLG